MVKHTGKRNRFDWSVIEDYDDTELIGVCLTQLEVMILKACLIPAYWSARWIGFPGSVEAKDTLNAMISGIDSQLDGNDCPVCNMEFRDNPLDRCEVQYSNDGGDTWAAMFRKDTCPTGSFSNLTTIYEGQTEANTNHVTWDNDITNVAPGWEYVDAETDAALCLAISMFIDTFSDQAITEINKSNQELRDSNNWLDDLGDAIAAGVIAIVGGIAAAAGATITWNPLVVAAIVAATMWLIEDIWDYLNDYPDPAVFADNDARNAVHCHMYNNLKGSTVQFTPWSTSLDDFATALPNEVIIRDYMIIILQSEDVFINYMMLMENLNEISEHLDECDCPEPVTINQLAGPTGVEFYGTALTVPSSEPMGYGGDDLVVAPGVWSAVTERYDGIDTGTDNACGIRVTLPADRLVTKLAVKWGATRHAGATYGDKNGYAWIGQPSVDGVMVLGVSWGAGTYDNQNNTTVAQDPLGLTETPRTHIYLHNSIDRDAADGACYFQWIYIETIPYEV